MAMPTQDATRQQLDELDNLLQKMLALPVAQIDEALPAPKSPAMAAAPTPPMPPRFPPPAVAYGLPPAADFAASSAVTSAVPPKPVSPSAGWAIDLNPKQTSSVLGGQSPIAGAAERPSPTSLLGMTALPSPVSEPVSRPSPRSRGIEPAASVALPLRPLAAVSRGFDEFMAVFGPLGRIATGPAGRGLMGYAGLAMLTASAAWCALAWVGWSW